MSASTLLSNAEMHEYFTKLDELTDLLERGVFTKEQYMVERNIIHRLYGLDE